MQPSCYLHEVLRSKFKMFGKLPVEILSKVFSLLSIRDCRAAADAHRYVVERVSDDISSSAEYLRVNNDIKRYGDQAKRTLSYRLSVNMYLGNYFPNVDMLFKSMIFNNAVISGSRAIEFFVPGCITENSDWDIYIADHDQKVTKFMDDMKSNGIKWITKVDEFKDLLDDDSEEITIAEKVIGTFTEEDILLMEEYVRTAARILVNAKIQFELRLREVGKTRAEMEITDKIYELIKYDGSIKYAKLGVGTYPDLIGISIKSGILSYRKRKTKVQLIICRSQTTPLDTIRNFHASITQCFISPCMACHMYSYDLYSKSSSVWNTPYAKTSFGKQQIAKSINKYKDRGFRFYTKSMHQIRYPRDTERSIKRIIGDSNTDVIATDLSIPGSWSTYWSLFESVQSELYNYSWIELNRKLIEDKYSKEYKLLRFDKTLRQTTDLLNESNANINMDDFTSLLRTLFTDTILNNLSELNIKSEVNNQQTLL